MGLGVDETELDEEMREMMEVWIDFEEFGILPWDRNAKSDDIYTYWKNGLRFVNQMQSQAKRNMEHRQVDSEIADDIRKREQRRRLVGR